MTNSPSSQRPSTGYMLAVIAIVAALAAIVLPRFAGRTQQALAASAQTEIAIMARALDSFEGDNGYFPRGLSALEELRTRPSGLDTWRGPYIADIPPDPWGNAYQYKIPGHINATGYDLVSAGPDGLLGTDDDIGNFQLER